MTLVHELEALLEEKWSDYAVDGVAEPNIVAGDYQGKLDEDTVCVILYGRPIRNQLSSTGGKGAEKWQSVRIVVYAKVDRDAQKVLSQYTRTIEKIIDDNRTGVEDVTCLNLIPNPVRTEDRITEPPEGFLVDEVHLTAYYII